MTITVDHDKMLRSLLDDDFVPTGSLAVPAQVNVVLRKHPEADELLLQLNRVHAETRSLPSST